MNTKNDVAKVSMESEMHYRRVRRRHRGMFMYCVLVVLMAAILLVSLSMTVFFNIKEIYIDGDASYVTASGENREYTLEEIVEKIEIGVGDNMVRLDVKKAEERGLRNLIYVESIEITREFPNTLRIAIQKCTPAYNLKYDDGTLVLSEHGRILENSMNPMTGLMNIYGYDPEEPNPGTNVRPKEGEEQDEKILQAFMDLILHHPMDVPIVSVDMSNRNGILVNFDNRIEFDMGDYSEMEYKIDFAQNVISKQPPDKEGYLVMIGSNQCSFRNKADAEATRREASGKPLPNEETQPVTDENGNPVAETETETNGQDSPAENPPDDVYYGGGEDGYEDDYEDDYGDNWDDGGGGDGYYVGE